MRLDALHSACDVIAEGFYLDHEGNLHLDLKDDPIRDWMLVAAPAQEPIKASYRVGDDLFTYYYAYRLQPTPKIGTERFKKMFAPLYNPDGSLRSWDEIPEEWPDPDAKITPLRKSLMNPPRSRVRGTDIDGLSIHIQPFARTVQKRISHRLKTLGPAIRDMLDRAVRRFINQTGKYYDVIVIPQSRSRLNKQIVRSLKNHVTQRQGGKTPPRAIMQKIDPYVSEKDRERLLHLKKLLNQPIPIIWEEKETGAEEALFKLIKRELRDILTEETITERVEEGQRYGRLTVLSIQPRKRAEGIKYKRALVRCDCGDTKLVLAKNLTRSKDPIRSCGCSRKASERQFEDFVGQKFGDWTVTGVIKKGNARRLQTQCKCGIKRTWRADRLEKEHSDRCMHRKKKDGGAKCGICKADAIVSGAGPKGTRYRKCKNGHVGVYGGPNFTEYIRDVRTKTPKEEPRPEADITTADLYAFVAAMIEETEGKIWSYNEDYGVVDGRIPMTKEGVAFNIKDLLVDRAVAVARHYLVGMRDQLTMSVDKELFIPGRMPDSIIEQTNKRAIRTMKLMVNKLLKGQYLSYGSLTGLTPASSFAGLLKPTPSLKKAIKYGGGGKRPARRKLRILIVDDNVESGATINNTGRMIRDLCHEYGTTCDVTNFVLYSMKAPT